MHYAFILGRVFTLSLAELLAVLKRHQLEFSILAASEEAVIVETAKQIDFEKLQKELGGIIKIVKIIDILKKREKDSINFALRHYFKPSKLKKDYFKEYAGKKQFGISIYLLDPKIDALNEPKRIGMFIKKPLQEIGASVRAVFPPFEALALASVVVTKNLLLQKGAEVCVIAGKDKVYVGKTLIVQDFEDYGRRDYQRPVRDEKQGMIPPKVAQVMLNLADVAKGKIILDPFCGVGTIVQEGILLGYKMYGSDLNPEAIRGSEKNLEWFRNRYKVAPGRYRLETGDATNAATLFKGEKIASIVSEGTLGPLYGSMPKMDEIKQNFIDLARLWALSFNEFKKLLESGSRVVICLPSYRTPMGEYISFPQVDFITDLGYDIEDLFPSQVKNIAPFLKVSERNSIIYDRKDQIVAREIIVFKKR